MMSALRQSAVGRCSPQLDRAHRRGTLSAPTNRTPAPFTGPPRLRLANPAFLARRTELQCVRAESILRRALPGFGPAVRRSRCSCTAARTREVSSQSARNPSRTTFASVASPGNARPRPPRHPLRMPRRPRRPFVDRARPAQRVEPRPATPAAARKTFRNNSLHRSRRIPELGRSLPYQKLLHLNRRSPTRAAAALV
eukprot:SAG11_NODE_3606_length_2343_cov_2.716132_1_plen_197_part_00